MLSVARKAANASARVSWLGSIAAAAMLLGSMASVAAAAEETQASKAQADEEATEELEEVKVTGTRIQSPNVTSANPINSISGEELRNLGIVNVGDAITQLVPQNISTYMPTMVGDDQAGTGAAGMESLDRSAFFIGNNVANLRGLDPVFGSRTLTLVDGRRMPSTSNQADVVDLNVIPSNLLERVDVVTGGASATYGSGAMAGVVNLMLNNKMQGINVDVDYGMTEERDGKSPHIALSGGTALLGGRAHALFGAEWQDTKAIWDCAAARAWCAESRTMFNNYTGSGQILNATFTPLPGFTAFPARFEMANVRYSQFSPTGMIASTDVNNTSGVYITADGRGIYDQPFGFRGGGGGVTTGLGTSVMNGDGPVVTSGTPIRPSSERATFFTNFEFNLTENSTVYFQGNYSRTTAENRNRFTTSTNCVRFQTQGVNGTNGAAGDIWYNGVSSANGFRTLDGNLYGQGAGLPAKSPNLQSPGQPNVLSEAVRLWLGVPNGNSSFVQGNGWAPGPGGVGFQALSLPAAGTFTNANGTQYTVSGSSIGVPAQQGQTSPITLNYSRASAWPFWIPVELSPNPPQFAFNGNAQGTWVRVRLPQPYLPNIALAANLFTPVYPSGEYWILDHLTLLKPFEGGTSTIVPSLGRNSYAYLNQLEPEALTALQLAGSGQVTGNLNAWGNATTAGAGAGLDSLYGTTPCSGFTAVRKVWNPQIRQTTTQKQEPVRGLVGIKGRFGQDWRYDAYFQYGRTTSTSVQHNASTNLRLSFAMDAVIDDRLNAQGQPLNPLTYGRPICRIVRDGPPQVDFLGRPVSSPGDLAELGADCQPLNIFGDGFTGRSADEIATQQQALAYAFVDSVSTGSNSLQTLSVNTNGTLWQGWAGPLAGAFGLELREDKVHNSGTEAAGDNLYERADLARAWADSFGGRTKVTELFTELDMPLVSGVPGLNLWSVNLGGRWTQYDNKGGAGTTGESRKQDIFNWKVQTVFEPFDWLRLRLSRSADLRTAGYRELFINQIGIPDELARGNPWRDRAAFSTENQTDRYGRITVGNINLKPEKSGTLTVGLVLSPSGWARGLRFTADYYNIKVRDAIGVPFSGIDPVTGCFDGSGNNEGRWDVDGNPEVDPKRDEFNYDYQNADGLFPCREIQFGVNGDGTRNLQDIVSINSSRPQNLLPYQRRGIDLSLSYNFGADRIFKDAPGNITLSVRGTRALESSGIELQSQQCTVFTCIGRLFRNGEFTAPIAGTCSDGTLDLQIRHRDPAGTETSADPNGTDFVLTGYNCARPVDLVGQIRSGTFIPGVAATPRWAGNATVTYAMSGFQVSLNARYVGGAKIDNDWCDSAAVCSNYQNATGNFLLGSVDNNKVKPYVNYSLTSSYDLKVANTKQFQVFGSVANLLDKSPPFTGGGISGATANYHDTLGRAYRLGVRMKF